jgi:ABC-type transport system involved in multi-copper enzyme maturation permease subunit
VTADHDSGPPRSGPSVWSSAVRIFDLSLGQMLWSRRSVFLALVVGGPIVFAAALRVGETAGLIFTFDRPRQVGSTIYGMMMWLMYVRFIVPVLGVFYGTSLIADEIDDKTITYLFTRPIQRSAVVIGKYLAYLVCTTLLVLPSAVIVFFLAVPLGRGRTIAEMFPTLVADLAALGLGLAAYGAVFAFAGARLKRPLLVGLIFALGWEPAVLLAPGFLKRATVAYYLQALVRHQMPQDGPAAALTQVFREIPPVSTSIIGLVVIVAGGLWLAGRTVERREYVLEQ